MVDPIALTIFAIVSTFRGDVPPETWFPLFRDFGMIILDKIVDILTGVLP